MRFEILKRKPIMTALAATIIVTVVSACAPDPPLPDTEQHRAEIEAWQAKRVEDLRKPDGWLAMAGLFWLEEGESSFGSDSSNDVVFPAFAPSRIGTFTRSGYRVTMRVEGATPVTRLLTPSTSLLGGPTSGPWPSWAHCSGPRCHRQTGSPYGSRTPRTPQ